MTKFSCNKCLNRIEALCQLTTTGAFVRYVCPVHGVLYPETLLPPIRPADADKEINKKP